MKNEIDTLFLDFDGPILDNRRKYAALHRHLLRDVGGVALGEDEYWSLKRTRVPEIDILQHCGVPESHWDDYLRRRQACIENEEFLALDQVWTGVRTWLVEQNRGCAIYLVTLRKRRATLLEQLDRLELLHLFDDVLSEDANDGSASVKVRLMAPFVEPGKRGVLIGDTEADIRAAKESGVRCIAVTCGIRDRRLLEAEEPDAIYTRLVDVNLTPRSDLPCEVLS